jgi:tight adherence protein B
VGGAAEAVPIALAAVGGGLLVAALRDALASLPAFAAWIARAVEPLRRAGSEGYEPSEGERRRLAVVASLLLPLMVALVMGPGPAPLFAVAGPAATGWMLARRRDRYRRAVESELATIASATADAIGAGRSVRAALGASGEVLSGPPGAEMARLRADLDLGAPTRVALRRFCARLDSPRADAFAAALLTNDRSGGDLAELLRRFAAAAKERERVVAEARAATAQARFTALLVVGMPVSAGLLAELAHPGFVAATLREPLSLVLLGVAAGLQVSAFIAIRRLGAVER